MSILHNHKLNRSAKLLDANYIRKLAFSPTSSLMETF